MREALSEQPTATDFTPEQYAYLEWVALPREMRSPKTVAAYAAQKKLDRTTLWRWSKLPGFKEAASAAARAGLQSELSEILTSLAKQAKKGDVPAIRLALEVMGEYTPRQEHTGANGGPISWQQLFAGDDAEKDPDAWGSR